MDDPKDKDKWETTNRTLQKQAFEKGTPTEMGAMLPTSSPDPTSAGAPDKPEGVIAGFQAGRIQRKAALQQMEAWYGAQLDIAKHRLTEVARVKKAQTTVIAEQFLRNLDQQHLEYLTNLGLRNTNARGEALIKLGDQTAKTLKELEDRDWPPALVEQTIKGVIDLHERFFGKLMEELGEKP